MAAAIPVGAAFVVQNEAGIDLTATYVISTSTPEYPAAPFAVGTRVTATNGSVWVFVQANGTIAQYNAVWVDPTFALVVNVGGAGLRPEIGPGQIGFCQASGVASGTYFWCMIAGEPIVNVASAGVTVPLYTLDTAGALSGVTNTASHSQVMGVVCYVTASGSTASATQVYAAFPVISRTGG